MFSNEKIFNKDAFPYKDFKSLEQSQGTNDNRTYIDTK